MPYKCPHCGNTTELCVNALVTLRLTQTEDNFETEPVDNNHEWDDTSLMICGNCEYQQASSFFDTEHEDYQNAAVEIDNLCDVIKDALKVVPHEDDCAFKKCGTECDCIRNRMYLILKEYGR